MPTWARHPILLDPSTAGEAVSEPVTAPPAPGRLGQPVDSVACLAYLTALDGWRAGRRSELDLLDRTALQAHASGPEAAALTSDIALSLTLWKAVSDRYEQLRTVWDSGRVGPAERERLSTLIWGRLDSSNLHASGLSMSLPEACRLSDALAGQLRVRLGLELSGAEVTTRIRGLRAQLERIREQIATEPAGTRHTSAAERQSRLARRLKDITEKADRGGDVGGVLEPLEIEATVFERDLIVGGAQRREAAALLALVRRRRGDVQRRQADAQALVDRCRATVDPAPRYAVPDVNALGPVPNTATALADYLRRLDRVAQALTKVEQANSDALARHLELGHRLEAYRAKAEATGVAADVDLARTYVLATEALHRRPTPIGVAEQLVTLYQTYLSTVAPTSPPTSGVGR